MDGWMGGCVGGWVDDVEMAVRRYGVLCRLLVHDVVVRSMLRSTSVVCVVTCFCLRRYHVVLTSSTCYQLHC